MSEIQVATNQPRGVYSHSGLAAYPSEGTPLRLVSAAEWASVARTCPQFSFQQSPAYSSEIARRRRASCEFVYITDAQRMQEVVGVASVRVRTVPIFGGGIAYISSGPLLVSGIGIEDPTALLRRVIDALVGEYVNKRRLFLRLTLPTTAPEVSSRIVAVLTGCGFGLSTTGAAYRTFIVDLRPPMAEIRATLSRKWRNQLTAAQRGPVTIELSQDAHAIARFAPLFAETSERKGFTTELGASFYDRVQRGADAKDRLLVAIANEDDKDVAGVVASVGGETAVYILGATTAQGLKSKAAYALHWRVMEAARDAGCRWYDLGGINPEDNPGVYHFKSGFGGSDVVVPGPFDIRPPGLAGLVSNVVDCGYARLKRWR